MDEYTSAEIAASEKSNSSIAIAADTTSKQLKVSAALALAADPSDNVLAFYFIKPREARSILQPDHAGRQQTTFVVWDKTLQRKDAVSFLPLRRLFRPSKYKLRAGTA